MGLEEVRATWERLGDTDPLWAVLTDPGRRNGGWENDIDEFLASGHEDIRQLNQALAAHGLVLGGKVLDFGCGVGRLSNALAHHVESVTGVDISHSMVERANDMNRNPDRVRFTAYDGHRLPFPDASFDSAVSLLVLQHSPPEAQIRALLEICRVVRPGGPIVVQIPSPASVTHPLPTEAFRAQLTPLHAPTDLPPGDTAELRVRVRNASSHTWPVNQQIRLANHWLADGNQVIRDDGRADVDRTLESGKHIDITLPLATPVEEGHYELELDMVQEGVSWFADQGSEPTRIPLRITPDADAAGKQPPPPGDPSTGQPPDDEQPGSDPPDSDPADISDPSGIEMHGLETELVHNLFRHCSCHVVATRQDSLAGVGWDSHTYFVRRGHSR